jgi:hypothetical protein
MNAMKRFSLPVACAIAPLCAVLSSCAAIAGCSVVPESVSVWGGDVSAPELTAVTVEGEETLLVRFTAPVTVLDASVTVPSDGRRFPASWTALDGGKTASFAVAGTPGIGVRAFISGSVTDGTGSTLSFSVPYTGYNPRPASLVINEIRLEYDKPKVEYVELVVREAGNLGGVQILNSRNEKRSSYEFPAVEVAAGDFVVYHLRSVEEGLVNETGAIDVSAGKDSSPFARDFWDDQKSAPLKSDNAILVRERDGGRIMDALLFSVADSAAWPSDAVSLAAEEAVAAGQWKPGASVADSFRHAEKDPSPTRTLGRDEKSTDTDTAADWAFCKNGKCSPGKANPAP